eukprot:11402994-Alexandrium_andersonii.AAC.1
MGLRTGVPTLGPSCIAFPRAWPSSVPREAATSTSGGPYQRAPQGAHLDPPGGPWPTRNLPQGERGASGLISARGEPPSE